MMRWCRRLIVLGLIGVTTALVLRARRAAPTDAGPAIAPESAWPPLAPSPVFVPVAQDGVAQHWVAPVDGACPEGFTIKANSSSMIFHVPGGRFYDRTIPQRCYPTAAAAERDGYRRAKA